MPVTCDMLALSYLFVESQEASNIQPRDLTPRTKEWETIVVDEFVPCNVSCGQPRPAFARPLGEEIWVLLLLGVSQLYRRPKSILKKHEKTCRYNRVQGFNLLVCAKQGQL